MNISQIESEHLAIFCCPTCRSELPPEGNTITCASCGHTASRLGTNLYSFLPADDSNARAILAWPPAFVRRLSAWERDTEARDPEFQAQLLQNGLVRPDGSLTPLGDNVHYHVSESHWQSDGKYLDGMLELGSIGPHVRVLDVGCGAAQTLRQIGTSHSVDLFGVDCNPDSLALGHQLAQLEDTPVSLAMTTAYSLPLRDNSFDLVITRISLNYMQQRRALAEMSRVLRPGGILFCRTEGIWYDLLLIARSPSPRALVCRGRDLAYGVIHSLTGWQLEPGSTWRGGRAFATPRRISHILHSLGFHVLQKAPSLMSNEMLGHRTQFVVIARKGD